MVGIFTARERSATGGNVFTLSTMMEGDTYIPSDWGEVPSFQLTGGIPTFQLMGVPTFQSIDRGGYLPPHQLEGRYSLSKVGTPWPG